jgi:hypothetical protein
MRKLKTILALIVVSQLLAGCELIAAGVIGAEIEKQNQQRWCYYHPGRC